MILTRMMPKQQAEFDAEAISLDPDVQNDVRISSPFDLGDDDAYRRWRDAKLANFPSTAADLVVEVADPANLSDAEAEALAARVRRAGMALYKGPALKGDAMADVEASKDLVRALGARFGLTHIDQNPYADEDAITPLHVAAGEERKEAGRKMYIPYTSRPISWHTDGYYNSPARRIRAMVLHCVRQAGGSGGENALFDPEIAYLLLRDSDPEALAALCRDGAMGIPGNDVDAEVDRGDMTGPVFSLNKADGSLHMRYTARKRNIQWADDDATRRAVAFLENLLSDGGEGEPYIFRHRMEAGEGLLCNNILHTRTAFEDGADDLGQRMMLRARYLDRVG
ncbi:TauD/TfdA family dioxygenase [Pseudomonadota bacterium]